MVICRIAAFSDVIILRFTHSEDLRGGAPVVGGAGLRSFRKVYKRRADAVQKDSDNFLGERGPIDIFLGIGQEGWDLYRKFIALFCFY